MKQNTKKKEKRKTSQLNNFNTFYCCITINFKKKAMKIEKTTTVDYNIVNDL
jgi:hypothetical protein